MNPVSNRVRENSFVKVFLLRVMAMYMSGYVSTTRETYMLCSYVYVGFPREIPGRPRLPNSASACSGGVVFISGTHNRRNFRPPDCFGKLSSYRTNKCMTQYDKFKMRFGHMPHEMRTDYWQLRIAWKVSLSTNELTQNSQPRSKQLSQLMVGGTWAPYLEINCTMLQTSSKQTISLRGCLLLQRQ